MSDRPGHNTAAASRQTLADRVRAGEPTLGTFCDLGSGAIAEIAAGTGFDWVVVDLEHGSADRAAVLDSLRGIAAAGSSGLVRVPSCDSELIGWALDAGAAGLVIPRAESVADARRALDRSLYSAGRGVSPASRASRYGREAEYALSADARRLLMIQIETPGALADAEAIARLDGVDVLFLGPGDLGKELDISGADHPRMLEAAGQIVGAARATGKSAAVYVHDPGLAPVYRELGFTLIASGFDSSLVATAYDRLFRQVVDG